jgi:poly [ADP-ribose] polymerase
MVKTGKLAKSTILQGFAALKVPPGASVDVHMLTSSLQILAEVINNPDGDQAKEFGGIRSACEHLSSSYYS